MERLLSREYSGKELHSMSTSGSTGTPLTIKQNRNKRNRVLAEIIYFGEKCDYFIGDRYVIFMSLDRKEQEKPHKCF